MKNIIKLAIIAVLLTFSVMVAFKTEPTSASANTPESSPVSYPASYPETPQETPQNDPEQTEHDEVDPTPTQPTEEETTPIWKRVIDEENLIDRGGPVYCTMHCIMSEIEMCSDEYDACTMVPVLLCNGPSEDGTHCEMHLSHIPQCQTN